MGEVITNELGKGVLSAVSAGAKPSGEVNPLTIETLKAHGHNTSGLRSKPLSEFLGQDFDYVITVCDSARKACPYWPGKAIMEHWDIEDPAEAAGNREERLIVFERIYQDIRSRIERFLNDSLKSM